MVLGDAVGFLLFVGALTLGVITKNYDLSIKLLVGAIAIKLFLGTTGDVTVTYQLFASKEQMEAVTRKVEQKRGGK